MGLQESIEKTVVLVKDSRAGSRRSYAARIEGFTIVSCQIPVFLRQAKANNAATHQTRSSSKTDDGIPSPAQPPPQLEQAPTWPEQQRTCSTSPTKKSAVVDVAHHGPVPPDRPALLPFRGQIQIARSQPRRKCRVR